MLSYVNETLTIGPQISNINVCLFMRFEIHKYWCGHLNNIHVHVMPLSDFAPTHSMTSTQSWPEQGWALLQILLLVAFSQAEDHVCRQLGDPENPHLSKDGDIILGGIFSFHSSWKNKRDTYMHKPLPLQCIR